jgi:2-polyprenyl-6-methoxyphenol hydroxylase-like FAD-dependent oxidoreductase
MNNNSSNDVIIIGARVAGSVLATLLGEMGHRVLVIDRSTFPSDTLSTHFFRAPALRAFKNIGVYEEVQSAAPHLAVNYNVIDGTAFAEPVDRPDDYPFYLCVRRITLDDILVRRLKKTPNVELREGVKVTDLLRENDTVTGVKWKSSNQEGEEQAKLVVGADGVNSFMAEEVNAQIEHQEPVNRAMYYAYYRGITANEGPAAEFHYRGNTLVYCFPCDDDLTLLAVSVPITQFVEFKSNPEAKFINELEAMKFLAPRLSNAKGLGPVRGSGSIPGYLRIPYGEGWALVGDAAMAMDPWSGQGIDQASTHAVLLAQHLGDYLSGKEEWTFAMQAYHQERKEFSLKTYQRTCKFSVDLRPMTRAALERRGLL